MKHRSISVVFATLALAFSMEVGGLCSSALSQTAILDPPARQEPNKGWWDSDPQRYKAFVALEAAEPDLTIDGTAPPTQTITVKPGAVIEVRFPEMYRAENFWFLCATFGPHVDMVLTDTGQLIENGVVQLHKPGYRLWKLKLPESGEYTLTFDYGKPHKIALNSAQPVAGQVTITLKVQQP